jgi:monomeric sarcosine oxidase
MPHFDAIVLGSGGIGSAALYELARRGVRAIGIDRFAPPHDRGSSHGQTRIIRQAYFEHPDYVPLVLESYRAWHELEQHVKRKLFCQTGLVEIGPPHGGVVPGVLRAAAEHGLAVEQLWPADVVRRWPGLRSDDEFVAVFEPTAGYLLVEDCVRAQLDAAQNAGAQLLPNTNVFDWTADAGQVKLQTSDGEVIAERLIITAGAWAASTLASLSLRLTVRRKSLFWFETETAHYDTAAGFPAFLFELANGVFYGFPKLDARGVKIGEHSGGRSVANPLVVDRAIDAIEQAALVQFLSAYTPGVSPRVTDHSVCLYTMSPDEHFIVDRHPAHTNVAFAAGLSGHGFKFAPVLGRALADLVLDGATQLPIGFLSLSRFT